MTYLELCQEVHRLIRAGNSAPGSQPSTLSGATLLNSEIGVWVKRAWTEIQKLHDWTFLVQGNNAVTLSAATADIPTASISATFAKLKPFIDTCGPYVLIYASANGVESEGPCRLLPYQNFRGFYDRQPVGSGTPTHCTEMPDRSLRFNTTADQIHIVRCDYYVQAQEFSADADTPLNHPVTGLGLQEDFHEIIVWRAVQNYCATREDLRGLYQFAERNYRNWLTRMRDRYLPDPQLPVAYV